MENIMPQNAPEVNSVEDDTPEETEKKVRRSWWKTNAQRLIDLDGFHLWRDTTLDCDNAVFTLGDQFGRLTGRDTRTADALRRILRRVDSRIDCDKRKVENLVAELSSHAETPVKVSTSPLARTKAGLRVFLLKDGSVLTVDPKGVVNSLSANDPAQTGVVFDVSEGDRFPKLDVNVEQPYKRAVEPFRFLNLGNSQAERDDIAKFTATSLAFRMWDVDQNPQLSIFLSGRRGGGKTTTAELFGRILTPLDPDTHSANAHIMPFRVFGKGLDELARAARGQLVTTLDNVGVLSTKASDDLATFLSGADQSVRRLFSEAVERIPMTRLWVFTGLFPSGQADLIDRLVEIPVSEGERPVPPDMVDGELFSDWIAAREDDARSGILRLMVDAVRKLARKRFGAIPGIRFGKFGEFVRAVDAVTGWNVEEIAMRLHTSATVSNVADNPFATILTHTKLSDDTAHWQTADGEGVWIGSAEDLASIVDEKFWETTMPSNIKRNRLTVGRQLKLVAPALEIVGWKVEQRHTMRGNVWVITPSPEPADLTPDELLDTASEVVAERGGVFAQSSDVERKLAGFDLPGQLADRIADAVNKGEALRPEWRDMLDGKQGLDGWKGVLFDNLSDVEWQVFQLQVKAGMAVSPEILQHAVLADDAKAGVR